MHKETANQMSEDVGQAYAPEYDFPEFAGKGTAKYVLATIPRSGSTFFSHELWKTGHLGAPLEYLNFDGGMLLGDGRFNPYDHFCAVKKVRTSPNGVFGVKIFPNDIKTVIAKCRPLFEEILHYKFVYLTRDEKLKQAISYTRAKQTGAWAADITESRIPVFNQSDIDLSLQQIEIQEKFWSSFFERFSIQPLHLTYEHVSDNPLKAIGEVAGFLGVQISPIPAICIPKVKMQADALSSQWAAKYAFEKASI